MSADDTQLGYVRAELIDNDTAETLHTEEVPLPAQWYAQQAFDSHKGFAAIHRMRGTNTHAHLAIAIRWCEYEEYMDSYPWMYPLNRLKESLERMLAAAQKHEGAVWSVEVPEKPYRPPSTNLLSDLK